MGGISIWQLLIVLAIIVLIFGTKKLRNIGGDIGGAIKNFKRSMKEGGAEDSGEDSGEDKDKEKVENSSGRVIEGEVTKKEKDSTQV